MISAIAALCNQKLIAPFTIEDALRQRPNRFDGCYNLKNGAKKYDGNLRGY
jgi:hypothetical protein